MTLDDLTNEEGELLSKIKDNKNLPIVRFELRNSKEKSVISTALNHVLITSIDDSMEQVKKLSVIFQKLKELKLINLDYSLLVTAKSDYDIYYESDLYNLLCKTVTEGQGKQGFLFDTTFIKRGVATLTSKGLSLLK